MDKTKFLASKNLIKKVPLNRNASPVGLIKREKMRQAAGGSNKRSAMKHHVEDEDEFETILHSIIGGKSAEELNEETVLGKGSTADNIVIEESSIASKKSKDQFYEGVITSQRVVSQTERGHGGIPRPSEQKLLSLKSPNLKSPELNSPDVNKSPLISNPNGEIIDFMSPDARPRNPNHSSSD